MNFDDWLDANLRGALGGLTGTDWNALHAAEAVAELWLRTQSDRVALAFRTCVEEMQPKERWIAYHAVAFRGDWGHRDMLWGSAGFSRPDASHPHCRHEPRS